MVGSAATITTNLNTSTCANLQPTYAAAIAAARALASSSGDATNSVTPISTKFLDLRDITKTYGVDYYQIGVAVVFALIAAVSIMLAIGIAIRHKTLVIANVSIGLGIFILLFILCSGVTVAIVSHWKNSFVSTEHCQVYLKAYVFSLPHPDVSWRLLHETCRKLARVTTSQHEPGYICSILPYLRKKCH